MILLTSKVQDAIAKACTLHDGQYRKLSNKCPYVTHVFAVAWLVAPYTQDEDVLCAALLHDVLEDVASEVYNENQMISEFGRRVYLIVKGVTEDIHITPWVNRKAKYLHHLKKANHDILLVSIADKIHNLTDLINLYRKRGEILWSSFESNSETILWYHQSVLAIAEQRFASGITDHYRNVVEEAQRIFHRKG